MTKLSDDALKSIYDLVKQPFVYTPESGDNDEQLHPDPIGFMARCKVLSGFDQSFVGENGEVGFCQVPPKRLKSLDRDGKILDDNIRAALETDIRHFYYVNDSGLRDVDLMHSAWFIGPSRARNPDAETEKMLEKISAAREEVRRILEPEDVGQDASDLVKGVSGKATNVQGEYSVHLSGLDQYTYEEPPIQLTDDGEKVYVQATEREKRIQLYMEFLMEITD